MKMRNICLLFGCLLLFTGCGNAEENGQQHQNFTNKTTTINSLLSLKAVYFNSIKEVNGKKIIQNPANELALVNKDYSLPSNYAPQDLVRPNVPFSFNPKGEEKSLLRKDAATALEKMFASAKSSGIDLYAVSGYRSYSYQTSIFNIEVNSVGEDKAAQAVAIPGTSEHQTGLAMDIASKSTNLLLTQGFADTKEGKWLMENADRFGFILRYPKGKEGITHYEYEPWHFRYVGVKAATIIYKNNWTLEDYFNQVKRL